MLTTKLPDIEFAMATHLSRERISHMGIVGPDDHSRVFMDAVHVGHEGEEGIHHVPVAEVPRLHISPQHRAVVILRIGDHHGVLLGVKKIILRLFAVELQVGAFFSAKLGEGGNDFLLAAVGDPCAGEKPISPRVSTEMLEAGIPLSKAVSRGGVMFFKIPEHLLDRFVQAVEIEPVESDLRPVV